MKEIIFLRQITSKQEREIAAIATTRSGSSDYAATPRRCENACPGLEHRRGIIREAA